MMISTEIGSLAARVGEERAVRLVAEAGFDAWDLSMFAMGRYDWEKKTVIESGHPFRGRDCLPFVRKLRRIGEENGIVCNQAHAPFPVSCPAIRDLQKRAIECAAEAGAGICVIHPDNNKSAEENAEMFCELLPFAKEHGVTIATENMWNWNSEKDHAAPAACSDGASFLAHLEAVNDPFFAACLDLGHAEMKGLNTSAVEMIRALGPHLRALHIHDNDLHHDSHALPFTMQMDFPSILAALKGIGYSGDFTLESDTHVSRFADEDIPTAVKEMAEAARRLADLFEAM